MNQNKRKRTKNQRKKMHRKSKKNVHNESLFYEAERRYQYKDRRRSSHFSSLQTHVYDDGTNTFFWRAHSITVLVFMIISLLYVALVEDERRDDTGYHVKRGLAACVVTFCLWGMTQAKDGPFRRPHPALWRLVLCLCVVYELLLVFLLFQTIDDARKYVGYIDPDLGKRLPEQSYAEDCRLYVPDHVDGPFANLWLKWDFFVFSHLFGWFVKMIIVRDFWMCQVLSIGFELLEYSLEHQLPNFAECWWDHWIMDFLVCNSLGIIIGQMTLRYLNIREYEWRGLWNIRSYRGKMVRVIQQFTPYSWTRFDWKPTKSLKRWLAVIGIMCMFQIAELNTFYLKFVLWIPPPHFINWARMIMLSPAAAVAIRETFQYLEDPTCKKFGEQSWIISAMILTEVLLVLKFDRELILKPFPSHIAVCWIIAFISLVAWTIYQFYIRPQFCAPEQEPVEIEYDSNDGEFSEVHTNSVGNGIKQNYHLRRRPINGK
ncbi:phosphatidylserine synthase 2-like isoform X1 [Anneissia japonica]|uniref:phosphatidylserine synthase 2-like isoform X1 n=2 Tax=Anneissia japonica TaxID=1529436 RepID=UPI001425732A|nr:phosphatidylserine synthase 2-like isoform X1 [Anneissia japonica]